MAGSKVSTAIGRPARRSQGGHSSADSENLTTRQIIITAATVAFAARGFDGTTNKQIASAAGVAPGLLYHYFESKEDLFAAAYSYITRYRYERSRAVLDSELTLSGKIEALARDLVEMWAHDSPYVEFHARTLYDSHHQTKLKSSLEAARKETEQMWRSIVDGAKARGDLSQTADVSSVVDMCITWFTGVVTMLPSRGAERTLAATEAFVTAVEQLRDT